jgi:hypothetical protein
MQKVTKTSLQEISRVWWFMLLISATEGSGGGSHRSEDFDFRWVQGKKHNT